jgi:curved DNA-binding protein CbpA
MTDDKIEDLIEQIIQNSKLNKSSDEFDEHKKVDIDKVNFDEIDDKTKRAYRDIVNGLLDYYKILGVPPNASIDLIREKGREKLKNLHPDKRSSLLANLPPEQRASEKRKMEIQYKLIHEAYNVLKDPSKKKGYDIQKKAVDGGNFTNKKQSFEEFRKIQDAQITPEIRENARLSFREENEKMNKKHGFNPDSNKSGPIDKREIDRRFSDVMTSRVQQDIEYTPENIFEHKHFDQKEFNKKWEEQQKKKHKKKNVDGTMVVWNEIAAANDHGIGGGTEDFVPVDNDYSNIYATSNNNPTEFETVEDEPEENNDDNNDNDDDNEETVEIEPDQKFNNTDNVMKRFEEFQKQRDVDINKFKDKSIANGEFSGVQDNPFNISSQMKEIVGDDVPTIESHKRKTFDKDFAEVYKQLVYDK